MPMHILVVEDEHLALDDLLNMLTPVTSLHTIFGCSSATEALKHARLQPPDLVITDIRMPGMTGLELVRRLKNHNPLLSAIILSGHSEFEYAREGMRLGITEYLLKPVRTEQLLQTLENALAGIAEHHKQATQLHEARLVRLLLGGPRAADADPELWEQAWAMIVVVCENWESPHVWRDTTLERADFAQHMALYGFEKCDVIGIDGHIRVLLACLSGQLPGALERAAAQLQRMVLEAGVLAHSVYGIKPAGVSPATLLPDALRCLTQSMHFAAPTFIQFDQAPVPAPIASLSEQLLLLERALIDARVSAAVAQVHAIVRQLRLATATQADIIETLKQIFALFQRYMPCLAPGSLPDRSAIVAVLRRFRSYDELNCWLALQLQPALDQQRGSMTPRQLVHTLVAHMHTHYADDISLQDFVTEKSVSLAYFSRLFKDEFGMTFSDYLTHIRVEKAKELLVAGELRPGDISVLVGYEDPKYFSQVFRRVAGMAPLD